MEHNGIHFECSGSGEAVVLIHGLSLDHREWDEQLPALSSRYRVVRLDLRGFGHSAAVFGPYSHAEDVKAVLERLDISCAHIVGHSLGGSIAGDFAQLYPKATRSLVMVDAIITGWPLTHFWPTVMPIAEAARSGDMARAKRMWLEHDVFAGARRDRRTFAHLSRIVDDYSGWHLAAFAQDPERKPPTSTAEVLETLRMPTLVIVGELDLPDFMEIAQALATRVPHARKLVIADAGHMPNLETPHQFNRALLDFFAGMAVCCCQAEST